MTIMVVVANIWGLVTGEWKNASRQSTTWIVAGIVLLIVGVCVLAAGKELKVLHSISLGAPEWATPVAANGVLYIASKKYLWAVQQ